MKKVGMAIVTYVNNFGSFLQSYATSEAIENLGYETEVINIQGVQKQISMARRKYFLKRSLNPYELKSYAVTLKGIVKKRLDRDYAAKVAIRDAAFESFKDRHFTFSPAIDSWRGIGRYCQDQYSSVVVGSDQLWRPANIEGDYYTLNFVPMDMNKVAYATSFGMARLPKPQAKKARAFLPRIQNISVREKNGRRLVRHLTNRKVPVVCDPTMLLTREEWDKHTGAPIIQGDYILCYFLGANQTYPKFSRQFADEMGLKSVGLVHCAGYNDNVDQYYDEMPFDIDPFDFITLVKNAKYVLTDSFHCCVFSVIFEREFYAFRRFADDDEMSTNDRLVTLFDACGIEGRLLTGEEPIDEGILKEIDYSAVGERLAKNRERSLRYLKKSLQKGDADD